MNVTDVSESSIHVTWDRPFDIGNNLNCSYQVCNQIGFDIIFLMCLDHQFELKNCHNKTSLMNESQFPKMNKKDSYLQSYKYKNLNPATPYEFSVGVQCPKEDLISAQPLYIVTNGL